MIEIEIGNRVHQRVERKVGMIRINNKRVAAAAVVVLVVRLKGLEMKRRRDCQRLRSLN